MYYSNLQIANYKCISSNIYIKTNIGIHRDVPTNCVL